MFNPCVDHCYNKYGKQYSSDCDNKCDYAKVVKEKKELEEQLLRAKQELNYYSLDTCSDCLYCEYIKQIEEDCCSYSLYKCSNPKKNEYIDQFHIESKTCKDFYWNGDMV